MPRELDIQLNVTTEGIGGRCAHRWGSYSDGRGIRVLICELCGGRVDIAIGGASDNYYLVRVGDRVGPTEVKGRRL